MNITFKGWIIFQGIVLIIFLIMNYPRERKVNILEFKDSDSVVFELSHYNNHVEIDTVYIAGFTRHDILSDISLFMPAGTFDFTSTDFAPLHKAKYGFVRIFDDTTPETLIFRGEYHDRGALMEISGYLVRLADRLADTLTGDHWVRSMEIKIR